MKHDTRDHFWRMLLRALLALVALAARMIYAYYLDINMFERGPIQVSFWLWTCVICGLVFIIALPSRRSALHHPNQRASDRSS